MEDIKEKSADEIFKILDYECEIKPIINGGIFDFGYYHIYTHTRYSECDGCETEYVKEIIFLNHIKRPEHNAIMARSKYKNNYEDNYTYEDCLHLGVEELKAINKKIEELGW